MRNTLFVAALLLSAPAAAQETAQDAAAAPPAGELCGVISRSGPDTSAYTPVPGYSILYAATPLIPPPGQAEFDAVVCIRGAIYLGPVDHHVLTDLRVPLFIRDGERMAVLEMGQGGLSLRFTRGEPTAEERAALAQAIDRAHAELRGAR
jgi:hypothetical protein